jgi:hypothetical protein
MLITILCTLGCVRIEWFFLISVELGLAAYGLGPRCLCIGNNEKIVLLPIIFVISSCLKCAEILLTFINHHVVNCEYLVRACLDYLLSKFQLSST